MLFRFMFLAACLGVPTLSSAAESAAADEPLFVHSPEVHADGRVTLRYYAPSANKVSATSNVAALSQPLVRDEQGVWSVTVGPLAPDTYGYHFLVDGAVVIDPVNRHIQPWVWVNNQIHVPGQIPVSHHLQKVPHGQVHLHWYHSPKLQQTRRLIVYTPPGYSQSDAKYPVLFLLHGGGDDEYAWIQTGHAHHITDNLLAAGKTKPMVIVMPFGHDLLPTDPDFEAYDCLSNYGFVEEEFFAGVLPYVESEYRLLPGADNRAIAGLSMGGAQALRIGLTHPEQFHWIVGFSSATKKHNLLESVEPSLASIKAENPWLWLGCGKDDSFFEDSVDLDNWLTKHSVEHTTNFTEGGHNWKLWRSYLEETLPKLFQ